ncbi:hypothetical protein DFH09DRAFT_1096174 [Mycena vulgaris]|nr:hypothetical protein DFH09DRAFT_1096174 [Mycena vulgaris]
MFLDGSRPFHGPMGRTLHTPSAEQLYLIHHGQHDIVQSSGSFLHEYSSRNPSGKWDPWELLTWPHNLPGYSDSPIWCRWDYQHQAAPTEFPCPPVDRQQQKYSPDTVKPPNKRSKFTDTSASTSQPARPHQPHRSDDEKNVLNAIKSQGWTLGKFLYKLFQCKEEDQVPQSNQHS